MYIYKKSNYLFLAHRRLRKDLNLHFVTTTLANF